MTRSSLHPRCHKLGKIGSTVFQPNLAPTCIRSLDGWSAGLASVGTRSIYNWTLSSKAMFQNTLTSSHKSSRAEYPFTRAPCTGSESTNNKDQDPASLSENVRRATTVAKSSTIAICDFLGIHFSMRENSTAAPNCNGWAPFWKRTPPIHGKVGDPLEPSGKLPSVKITKSGVLGLANSMGRGGPSLINHNHCCSEITSALLSLVWFILEYWRSESERRKALPIFPQSCDAPNMSLPRSFPAWPGGKTWHSKMEEISSSSSNFRDGLIFSNISLRS